jgi:diamine N-acetyltransferase
MSNEDLIQGCRETELPPALAGGVEQLIAAAQALRPVHPPHEVYRISFAERCTLRELLDPDQHDTHWWPTGLYILQRALQDQPALDDAFGPALASLHAELDARLGPYNAVSLRQISSKTVSGICLLSELMEYPQNTFVAPNSYSLAEALFHPNAWYRAIYAGRTPVGFVMLEDDADKPEYFLWRFMIAPPFQRHGHGAAAVRLLVNYVRGRPGAKELLVSYIDHEEGPAEFYRGLGFTETGEVEDNEVIMRLDLCP